MKEEPRKAKFEVTSPSDTMELLSQIEQQNIPHHTVLDNIYLKFNAMTKADIKQLFMTIPSHFKAKLKIEY